MTIGKAFDQTIEYYDNWMQKALPNYHDLFASALDIIPFRPDAAIGVLDLGAGTGLFTSHVFGKYPKGSYTLIDLGEKMLEAAKSRFQNFPDQFSYLVGDYCQMQYSTKYDLVISSLSIHHLSDEDKQALFNGIFQILNKDGMFINIDQVKGETKALQELYWTHWLEQVNRSDATPDQIRDSIYRRQTYDRDALLADQLSWLKNAGFVNVDCVYKNFFVGVFMGMKV
jgi:tRNA (cmo5U34)-methyltransferase